MLGHFEQIVGRGMDIASGQEIYIQDIAKLINELTGKKASIIKIDWWVRDTKKGLLANLDQA